jgi:hypothetical protein
MTKAYLTPAAKKLTPIKLACGLKLRNGQIMGEGQTIATKGAAKNIKSALIKEGHRSRTVPGGIDKAASGSGETRLRR